MTDEQLVRFARLESENLSLPSFHALKDELITRNIDLQTIEELEDVDIRTKSGKDPNTEVTNLFVESLFEFVLNSKIKDVSTTEIYKGLLDKKLNPDQAFMILEMFEEIATKSLKNIETEILVAWISFFAAIVFCLLTFNPMGLKFLLGVTIIIAASIKLANSYQIKNKITLALENNKKNTSSEINTLYQ